MEVDRIIKSRRRTIAIEVKEDSSVIVRAPIWVSNESILELVKKFEHWIERKKAEISARNKLIPDRKFESGETLPYLGKSYELVVMKGLKNSLEFKDKFYLNETFVGNAREVFTDWYKNKSFDAISSRVEHFAKLYGFNYKRVKISSAKRRYGSCSYNGSLSFSWRLVLAPLDVIDYVVVHELVHLSLKNHSKEFWGKVATILPDYKVRRKWLKENELMLIG